MSTLQVIWFLLIGILLTGYAILDGFDLGVGFWHLFTKSNKDRRTMLNTIGPVWDGNEVWLLTGGGAMFAAFPDVYATVFSGLYLALMLVLFALIFRAVSLEFRSKVDSAGWRQTWDTAFALGSIIPALLFGVAVGNILRGLPLDASMNNTGSFWDLLNPYSLLVGLLALSMFATHGALYLWLKTDGDLKRSAKYWARKTWIAFLSLFAIATAITIIFQPQLVQNWMALPFLWIVPILTLLAMILIRVYIKHGHAGKTFIASCLSIVGLMAIGAISIFPNMVPALNDPALNLTISNASSSPLTLKTMLIIAIIGMPFVLGYSIWVHRAFGGKTSAGPDIY
jgi:cytochrome d ubiquinol oxidase subunit II